MVPAEHTSTPCPSDGELIAALRGELRGRARERVDAHLGDCDSCAELVAALVRLGWNDDGDTVVLTLERTVDRWGSDALAATQPKSHDAMPLEGRVGRYLLLELCGRGAMGAVWSAYDPALDRKVAIKLVPLLSSRAISLAEAQMLARVSDPHVVEVFDAGVTATHLFIVMELVQGTTLRHWLAAAPRSRAEILEVLTQAGRGLAAVHAAGLVHRDFKPDNVLIGIDGRAKVVDFGLAGILQDAAAGAAMHAGTPAYMAPEQHFAGTVTAACDQFAFCVALVEALTGKRPFTGTDQVGVLAAKIVGFDGASLGCDPPLRAVIRRGLATEPHDRFADFTGLLAALRGADRRRRARLPGLAWLTAVLAVVLAGATGASSSMAVCAASSDLRVLAGERISQIRERHRELGGEAWARAEVRLDAFATAWGAAHARSCDADVDAAVTECLAGQRRHTDAMLDVLAGPEVRSSDAALRVVARLPDPEACLRGDRAALPQADEADLSIAIASLRDGLVRADALGHAGAGDRAIALAAATRHRAAAVGFIPVLAEADLAHGRLLYAFGHYAESLSVLADAYHHAIAADHRAIAGRAAAMRLMSALQLAAPETVELWAGHVRTELARGPATDVEAELRNALGRYALERGDLDAAVESFEAAVAAHGEVLGAEHPHGGAYLVNLGLARMQRGEHASARELLERALFLEESLGRRQEIMVPILADLGAVLEAQGETALARDRYAQAVAVAEHASPDTALFAMVLSNLGNTELALGRRPVAIATFERALGVMRAAVGDGHPLLATIHFNLGDAMMGLPEPGDARGHLVRARELWETSGASHEADLADIERLLATL